MSDSLLGVTRTVMRQRDLQTQDELILCAHIKTAFSTESGKVLKAWLKRECFMDVTMTVEGIESAALVQRITARRDLFIDLEKREQRGSYVAND